jgi:hypothetical protein
MTKPTTSLRSLVAATIAIASLLLVSACAHTSGPRPAQSDAQVVGQSAPTKPGDAQPGTKATTSATPSDALPPNPALPLQAYDYTPEQADTVSRAVQILTTQCMSSFGFAPRPTLTLPDPPPAASSTPEYGLTDWHDGYLPLTTSGLTPADQKAMDDYQAWEDAHPTTAAYNAVLTGSSAWKLGDPAPPQAKTSDGKAIPPGGCAGQADAKVAGGDPYNTPLRQDASQPLLVKTLSSQAHSSMQQDPQVIANEKAWSTCMAAEGYHYTNTYDVGQTAGSPGAPPALDPRFQQDPPPADILAIARADVACQRSTNYEHVHYEVEARYQSSLIESNATALAEIQTAIDRQIRNATAIAH